MGTEPETARPARLSHRLEVLALRTAALLFRLLPEPVALSFGGALGWISGVVMRLRRGVVDQNLAIAFPDRDEGWRRRTARAAYFHLGREAAALLRLSFLEPRQVRERTEVEGLARIEELLAAGKGLVVLTGHLGNWEIGGAALACRGLPLDVVATRQANPLFDDILLRTRERLGMKVMDKKGAIGRALRSLRRGRAVALVADQNARQGGLLASFFGKPAPTSRGPALLALRSGAPVILGAAVRTAGPYARYRVHIEILRDPGSGAGESVEELTARYNEALERAIRRAPEQYFWHHRRWRQRPAQATSGPPAGEAVQEPS